MDHICLTNDMLSVGEISDLVFHESCGAVSVFVGTTRDNFQGKRVVRLEYEAYEPMALKALKSLCAEMREKWPELHGIAIYHRLGVVAAREASVIIAASSPHRVASMAAVAHCIDNLKATVPVWKKEVYEDGAVWKENKECPRKRKSESPEPPTIDKSLVQITVSSEELNSRIQNFIKRKREQVDLSNIHDFIPHEYRDEGECCARVRAVFVKRKDSKGHLKVHRVNNEWGPQTVKRPTEAQKTCSPSLLPPGVEERVRDIERFVSIRSVAPDVYSRLKLMEDRIRHLESISPEYANFWSNKSEETNSENVARKIECRYTVDEINKKIEELQHNSSTVNG